MLISAKDDEISLTDLSQAGELVLAYSQVVAGWSYLSTDVNWSGPAAPQISSVSTGQSGGQLR